MDADILQEVECKMECNKLDYQKICYNRSMNDLIKHKLELLPDSPGCYLHKNKYGKIIYVGKAKTYAIGCGLIFVVPMIPRQRL